MSGVVQEQMRTDHHNKLLDFWSTGRFVWLEHGLDLADEDGQLVFLERIEQDLHLMPNGATSVDVAIEYLFTQKHLTVQEVSPELRLHSRCTRGRLIHLAKVAHVRLKRRLASRTVEMELAA
jgi:hypothetical protein